MHFRLLIAACTLAAALPLHAQSYGAPVNLETAKKIAAAAAAEAKRNNWKMAIHVVDTHGFTVYAEVLDDTQSGSVNVALQKARTAALFRRPSKAFEDAVGAGRNAIMSLPDVVAVEGGEPIIVAGKVLGAIGVSGGSSAQDGQVARVGLDALK